MRRARCIEKKVKMYDLKTSRDNSAPPQGDNREAHDSIKGKKMKEELGGGSLLEVEHEDGQRMAETVDDSNALSSGV